MQHPIVNLLLVAFLLTCHVVVKAQSIDPVSIPGTQVRYLQSDIVGQKYKLDISLPRGYGESGEGFGVVYLLDSQWDFPLLYAVYGEQYYDGFLPPLILVGISWGGEGDDPNVLRVRDFTPTPENGTGAGGGAEDFLAFIREELTPFMEAEYKVKDNDRTLVGSSLGGLFTLYAAFESPGFFQRYIPTTPALAWDQGVIFKKEEQFYAKKQPLPGRLYSVIGGLEPELPQFRKMMSLMKDRRYEGLALDYKVLEGIGHSGCKPEGNTRGMQFAYKRNEISLPPRELLGRTGRFFSGQDTIALTMEENRLLLVGMNGQRHPLVAESPSRFYSPGIYCNLELVLDDKRKVSAVTVERFWGETSYGVVK